MKKKKIIKAQLGRMVKDTLSPQQRMQLDIDKANIVNREMNKNKLQNYIDKQKVNLDLILKRLIQDKDSIQTNINIPEDVLNELLNMINNLDMSDADKKRLKSKLKIKDINNNSNCPDYDTTGLVKKKLVSDVCFGCGDV